jgi:catechol 2,3-dioxygenase-like lactoylglutathione lyase family enzyme
MRIIGRMKQTLAFKWWRSSLYCWFAILISQATVAAPKGVALEQASTGISGVYEVGLAVADEKAALAHFARFGFKEIARAQFTAAAANKFYRVNSALTAIRLQNGAIDSHGLLRLLIWEKPLGSGVGYAPPETIGQRLSVMMVSDIVRLDDVFKDARVAGQAWLPITPVFADLFGQTEGKPDLANRRVGVRESGVYGELFNHVFFQRYGYQIKGYGTINTDAVFPASEFTHHDFIIDGDIAQLTDYYRDVLGFVAEKDISIDGDWLEGPKRVFAMPDGASHYYRGFVSPNNICGKLKFFAPRDVRTDRAKHQRLGEQGVTLHSLYSSQYQRVRQNILNSKLKVLADAQNIFGERSILFVGPDGATWEILDQASLKSPVHNQPEVKLNLVKTPN